MIKVVLEDKCTARNYPKPLGRDTGAIEGGEEGGGDMVFFQLFLSWLCSSKRFIASPKR